MLVMKLVECELTNVTKLAPHSLHEIQVLVNLHVLLIINSYFNPNDLPTWLQRSLFPGHPTLLPVLH